MQGPKLRQPRGHIAGSTLAASLLVVPGAMAGSAIVFSVADDFSIASNPNGPWSYGYSNGLGGPLLLFVTSGTSGPVIGWNENISLGAPGTSHNGSGATVTSGTVQYGPWQTIFHPGPSGQACVIRFVAPAEGTYALSASFVGADLWGTTTDVHVLVDGESVFSGGVSGFGPGTGPSFDTSLQLAVGAAVDFAVTTPNSFFNDSTGIDATLTIANPCLADLDLSGSVDAADLAILLGAWGTTEAAPDLDADGAVNASDLAILLGEWGLCA